MTAFFVFVLTLLAPVVAFAQEVVQVPAVIARPSAATQVLDKVIEIAASVLIILLTWLAHKVAQYFTKKTGIEIPAATELLIQDWAAKGVAYAEEQAHKANDANVSKLSGPAKLELAVQFVIDLAKEYGFADIAKDKIVKYIESYLGATREMDPQPIQPTLSRR